MLVDSKAGNDDPGFVRILADRYRRIDRDHDAPHRRQVRLRAPALLDQVARPKRAGHVLEDLGVEFLPA